MISVRKLLLGALLAAAAGTNAWAAKNAMLGEVGLEPGSRAERDAGVWVNGQYLGFVKELQGKNRLVLVPGRHELRVRLAGYEELISAIVVEPGERRRYTVRLEPLAGARYPDAEQTATVRLSVAPARAALFVNGVYAGHVDRFSGRGGLRLRAGTHRVRVALPGYRAFETELTLLPGQRYEIRTELLKGTAADQTDDLIARDLAGSR